MIQTIREALRTHPAADEAEAEDVQRVLRLLDTPSPFSRGQFDPGHLTASAVVLDRERQRTALIRHVKLQRWLQPGGHFEPGEMDPWAAAAREVFEETGLIARPRRVGGFLDVDVHAIPARADEPSHEHFDLRVELIVDQGTLSAGDGASAARWVGPDDLAGLDLDPGLHRALGKVWAERGPREGL